MTVSTAGRPRASLPPSRLAGHEPGNGDAKIASHARTSRGVCYGTTWEPHYRRGTLTSSDPRKYEIAQHVNLRRLGSFFRTYRGQSSALTHNGTTPLQGGSGGAGQQDGTHDMGASRQGRHIPSAGDGRGVETEFPASLHRDKAARYESVMNPRDDTSMPIRPSDSVRL